MSDFIVSNFQIAEGILSRELKKIYKNDEIIEFHGTWGSLAINNGDLNTSYIYSDEHVIIIALGNPISIQNLNKKINRLSFNTDNDWSQIINGPFVLLVINKEDNEINVVTDLMSFIPVYISRFIFR